MEQQKPSNRIQKMNSLIEHILGTTIRPFIEDLDGLVTITKVDTSADLKWAKVWISIVGGDDQKILKTLEKNIYDIQGELNHKLEIKIFPRISFHLDTSPRYAQHIDELIKQIHDEEGNKHD